MKKFILLILICCTTLSGCGQYGALYLPQDGQSANSGKAAGQSLTP
ncbi:MAG: lipoprotein [Gammaproteobacteria bacterium]|nr:lipoprotein [Gammaproteobacteria bacterium]